MTSTLFVTGATGATGQTGGNVCEPLIERGDNVRALVRNPDEATALAGIGVEPIKGDNSYAGDVLGAAKAHGRLRVVALSTAAPAHSVAA